MSGQSATSEEVTVTTGRLSPQPGADQALQAARVLARSPRSSMVLKPSDAMNGQAATPTRNLSPKPASISSNQNLQVPGQLPRSSRTSLDVGNSGDSIRRRSPSPRPSSSNTLQIPRPSFDRLRRASLDSGSAVSKYSEKPASSFAGHLSIVSQLRPENVETYWSWTIECISWALSMACLAAIIALLAAFRGRSIPNWPYGITINTIVAILATLETVFLDLPIARALAQVKWNWFDRAKPLKDFVTIEEASQGPLGSAMLMLRRRGGYLAFCGAALAVSIFGVAPFLQQIVSYSDIVIDQGKATMPIAIQYDSSPEAPHPQTRLAFFNALADSNMHQPHLTTHCPTGNCTWHEYQSLAVCGSCIDVSDGVDFTVNKFFPSWITEVYNAKDEYIPIDHCANAPLMAVKAITPKEGIGFTEIPWEARILDSIAVSRPRNPSRPSDKARPPKIEECMLHFCPATFSAVETNGRLNETRLTGNKNSLVKSPSPYDLVGGIPRYIYEAPGSSDKFYATTRGVSELHDYFSQIFRGLVLQCNQGLTLTNITYHWGNFDIPPYHKLPDGNANFLYPYQLGHDAVGFMQNLYNNFVHSNDSSLGPLFEAAATSLTAALRNPTIPAQHSVYANATGTQFQDVTIITIRWGWITMPVLLELAVFFFLLSIMEHTRRKKVRAWRDGSLESLIYGPEESIREEADQLEDPDQLAKFAGSIHVKVARTSRGWRLVRADPAGEDLESQPGSDKIVELKMPLDG